jgi:predicted dehydrogenase
MKGFPMSASRPGFATSSRRKFLQQSGGALAAAALTSSLSTRAFAGEQNTIKIAVVGCGHRGPGAACNALQTRGPTKLWAMADVFPSQMQSAVGSIAGRFPKQVDVPPERQFTGMDGYKKAIDSLSAGDVVILATPPVFRPLHLEYAVAKGLNVFMEKSFAVDAPGIRRVLKAGAEATRKNLKIAGGLRCRHDASLEGAVAQIHKGLIGDIIACWAYRMHQPVDFKPRRAGMNEMAHQIDNYSNFTWLNGTFVLDWLIHNLDVCCWIKGSWPVSAQGHGGRQQRTAPDQLFDHVAVEYTFADGTRMMAQGRGMNDTWPFFGSVIHGSRGSAMLGEGLWQPRIFSGYEPKPKGFETKPYGSNVIWQHKGADPNAYDVEHDLLFDAIRQDKPYNETEWSAKSAMTGIMGRMAAESGREILWKDAIASNSVLAPGLETMTMDSTPPVVPDAQGHYPVAIPGVTKAF